MGTESTSGGSPIELRNGELTLVGERWDPTGDARGIVVLLHGGGQTRHSWSGTASRLAGRGWTTIAIDLRGHGDSGWDHDGDYSLAAFESDVRALLSSLTQPAVLVGASLGGMTALRTAADAPELVRGLVLVDVVVRLERDGVRRIMRFMRRDPDGFASLDDAAQAIARYNPNRSRPPSHAGLRKNLRQWPDGRWHWHWDPAFIDNDDEPQRRVEVSALREAAGRLRCPVLLVRGGRSDVVSEAGLRDMLTLVPQAQAVDVGAAGHMVAGDDNDVFTGALQGFLDGLGAASGTPPSGA